MVKRSRLVVTDELERPGKLTRFINERKLFLKSVRCANN